MTTRRGKIARLPLAVREELNHRLLENQPAKVICAWLNELPETKSVLAEMPDPNEPGKTVNPIDDRNVSDWRLGGFADWLRRRQQIEETRELAQWSVKLAKAAGGNISEGASQILAGKLLELLEGIADLRSQLAGIEPLAATERIVALQGLMESVEQLSKSLAEVRRGDHSREKLDLDRQRVEQSEEALRLEREKFELKASELILSEALRQRAAEISKSDLSNAEKIAAMRRAAFADVDALERSGEVKLPT